MSTSEVEIMKRLLVLTIGICLLLTSVPVMADQAEDEAAIRKAYQKLLTAFNNHDAKAMMAMAAEVIRVLGWRIKRSRST